MVFDLKIATKLILSFGAVLVLTAALGVSAIFSMARINSASTDLSTNSMPSVLAAMSMRSDVSDFRHRELAHMLAAQDADMAQNETRMTETQTKLKADGDNYRRLICEPGEQEVFERFLALNDEFMRLHAIMLSLSREMKKEEALALAVGPSAKVMADMMVALDKLVSINTDGGVRASASADARYAASRASLIGLLAGIVVLGMLLALWVARQVAAGDLTAHIVVQSQDETGQLMQALKDMNARLQNLVGQVCSGTDTIATASSQIAAGNQDLSSRTEEQASSLEETASSMEELTSTVKQNADNARQANTMALISSSIVIEGGKVVSGVVGTMASINASSRKIVDIIAVIDGIAFQTKYSDPECRRRGHRNAQPGTALGCGGQGYQGPDR
nr:MCP four helix bundle domain-containing protein [Janthinobacterium sp. ROICE36]